ncbi:MAG: NnrS family protein [Pseudomonadota bacterium]
MSAGCALFNLGFRPFFLLACLYGLAAVLAWLGFYTLGWPWPRADISALDWHAHEMVFGYTLAVIAGFLLTAVRNWTGVQTLRGVPLLLLCLAWLAARCVPLAGGGLPLHWAMLADVLFDLGLVTAVAWPVFRVRQWRQLGILSKLLLLACANLLSYAGLLGMYPGATRAGLYSGVYLVMALIFVMARRVLPFFIERALDRPVQVSNRRWLDRSSLVLFLVFWLVDVLWPEQPAVAGLAAVLCLLHALRLAGWYARGLLARPLLAVLWLGYAWLVIGFALRALAPLTGIAPTLALHAYTYGGIGLFTLGMMVRVTLGHTGRSVQRPPALFAPALYILLAGAVLRVLLPLVAAAHYPWWIGLSQLCWLAAFSLVLACCLPLWLRPRVDGQPG